MLWSITIACDFRQFSAKKTNVVIQILQKLAVFWTKNTLIFLTKKFWRTF
jgi:hypothetical protein